MKIAKTLLCLIILFVVSFTSSTSASGSSKAEFSHFVVQFNNNLLTVKAKNALLSKVFEEIVDQTGAKISLSAPTEELVSVEFSGLSLEQGLKRLIRGFDYVFIYGLEKAKGGPPEMDVIIFSKSGGTSKISPKYGVVPPEKRAPQKWGSLTKLIKDLEDNDAEVREEAVDALADLKDKRAVIHLSKVLENDRDPDVRETAAEVLGDLGGPEAIAALTQAIHDRETDVRESAVDSLGQIGGDEAVDPLMEALKDGDEDVREAAAIALKRLTGSEYSY